MSSAGASCVNSVWHGPHEPRMVMRPGRPRAESRLWAGLGVTQQERASLHGAARAWLAEHCPGWFEAKSVPQSAIDLMLLREFDPTDPQADSSQLRDPLRALGVTKSEFRHWVSDDFPRMLLESVDESMCHALKNCYTLWGGMPQITSAIGRTFLDRFAGIRSRRELRAIVQPCTAGTSKPWGQRLVGAASSKGRYRAASLQAARLPAGPQAVRRTVVITRRRPTQPSGEVLVRALDGAPPQVRISPQTFRFNV